MYTVQNDAVIIGAKLYRDRDHRPIVVVEYRQDAWGNPAADARRFLAFYTSSDLGDMMHLFFPGDRETHATADAALAEFEQYKDT